MQKLIAMGPSPYLFALGCPRSGTTLLQRMLDAHPQLAVANDTHFIPRAIETIAPDVLRDPARLVSLPLTSTLVSWVRDYHRFSRLGLPDEAVDRAAAASGIFTEFVGALYQEYAEIRGKKLGAEKTPDYVRHLPLLHTLFPWAKTVHITRDGRDVALSTLEWAGPEKGPGKLALWREEPIAVCALWWRWLVGRGRRDGAALALGSYYEVKYEQLVRNPADTLRAITEFLQLPFATDMMAFHEGKTRYEAGLSAKKAWLPPTPGLRDWRKQMDARSVELFEALAGDLLSDLGYERRCTAISSEIAVIDQRCQDWWDNHLRRKEATVPSAWHPGRRVISHVSKPALFPDDAEVVRRDPGLVGLGLLLDPETFVAALRAKTSCLNLGKARISYMRYKPGTNCLVGYQVEVAGATVPVNATTYGPNSRNKVQKALQQPGIAGALGQGRIVLEDYQIVVSVFPNDRKIRGLPCLVDQQLRDQLFGQLFPQRPDLYQSSVRTLVYKPERRYVGQVVSGASPQALLKIYARPEYEAAYSGAKAFQSEDSLRVARLLGCSQFHQILAFEWVHGRLLKEVLTDPTPDFSAVATVGAALAELHTQNPKGLQHLTRKEQAASLRAVAEGIGFVCPHLGSRIRKLADRLCAWLLREPIVDRPIHGDCDAKQILLTGDRVAIIDFDGAVRGDPAAELGNFIAHLHCDALCGTLPADLVNPVRNALLRGYRDVARCSFSDGVDLYTAVGLLRLAPHPFRQRQINWLEKTEAIVERVEEILNAVHAPPRAVGVPQRRA